ncbi:uncharacterized protein LTR77_011031 [Saxophila tyrrhenica]|uniref:Endonuclease/exonuclease/phosphatase domain-containing protein n=1 Tax=Saxophila tyrrhenica TaxID=1690608 RepID=A0AAV9NU58_9PEZI|nr:hypothetical protein LTR77_011031 [Saxophila tyrrhenica]
MDELVQRSIQASEAKKRTAVPWEYDKPWKQPCYAYSSSERKWNASGPDNSTSSAHIDNSTTRSITLLSHNIDFMLPFADSRMNAAVRHLETLISALDRSTASVIFLQECVASDLTLLANDTWVQQNFTLTDTGTENWQSGHYGTVTLIDNRLPLASCFRIHFSQTNMQRDGLFVNVLLQQKTVRLCNTHLESLAFEPAMRPPQMKLLAQYMKDAAVDGAAVAGDFNAIQDFDRTLHRENGLKDAYLELGGDEDDAEGGHTWGQQASTTNRERFGTSRMDKVFYCGSLRCSKFERFGAGLEVQDEGERKRIIDLGFEKPWITDHLGVMAVLKVEQTQP